MSRDILLCHQAETIIEELTTIRRELGWSQHEVTARMSCSSSNLRNWETKTAMPTLDYLCRWAEVLGYEFDLHKLKGPIE